MDLSVDVGHASEKGGKGSAEAVATDLEKALERGEFRLYYQPKLDFSSGKIKGVESLIRWHR